MKNIEILLIMMPIMNRPIAKKFVLSVMIELRAVRQCLFP
jgi:hypothetical protein